jgi:hypothetical protein
MLEKLLNWRRIFFVMLSLISCVRNVGAMYSCVRRGIMNLHENLHTLRVLCCVENEVRFSVCQGFEVSVRSAAEVVEFVSSRNIRYSLVEFVSSGAANQMKSPLRRVDTEPSVVRFPKY